MADSLRPAAQLFNQVFGAQPSASQNRLEKLWSYIEQGGSIFPLVEKGVPALVSDYGLEQDEARRFLRRANSFATYVQRRFIDQDLQGRGAGSTRPSSGLLSMVDGPRLEKLFNMEFEKKCPPDSLESVFGHAAYLVFLYAWIRDHVESVGSTGKLPLHVRRTDLMNLVVDSKTVYALESSVDVIVRVLEAFIAAHTKDTPEDALFKARYPNELPYFQPWVAVNGVVGFKGRSVGDFANSVDLAYPYFLHTGSLTALAAAALAHASRLGPYQQQLLTEPYIKFDDSDKFYEENFGTDSLELQNLNQIPYFSKRTNLLAADVIRLLSVGDFAPRRSANVKYPSDETGPENPNDPGEEPILAESGRSGSVYINNNAHPAIVVSTEGSAFLHRIMISPQTPGGMNAFDRLNRKLRLDKWLDLPCEQTDALLVAAIRAEARGAQAEEVWAISENVVHALGLFQRLRERYNCTAADFAVFLDELSLYGRGDALSQFDQVFNNQANYRQPLKLDGKPFALIPVTDEDRLTISQLCSGLAIDLQTYQYLALSIARAHELTDALSRTPAIISSFYRLVKLPRLLNITPVEGVLMLSLLGDETWLNGLAGKPRIASVTDDSVTAPGVLSLIEAMQACVQWCEQSNLPVLWMLQHVSQPQRLSEFSHQDQQFFDKIGTLLPTARLSNNGFLVAGVPPAGENDWLDLLSMENAGGAPVVDVNGLVLPPVGTSQDYLAFARAKLKWSVENALGDVDEPRLGLLVETMLTVLLQARDAQASLVRESLAVYAGIDGELALLVLDWVAASVYQLLRQVHERSAFDSPATGRIRNEPSDPLMELLAVVRQRAEVVSTLDLSAALVRDYLDYGYQAWRERPSKIDPSNKYEFSMRVLHSLTTLTRAFSLSEQPEQNLLDYLRQVHSLPDLSLDAQRIVQQAAAIKLAEFFAWSVEEVSECVRHMDPAARVLKTLDQLDLLMRVYVLSTQTSMDARTILRIGTLPESTDPVAYAQAAELALLSETQPRVPIVQIPGELKQLVNMAFSASSTEVIARKPGEKVTITVTLTDALNESLKGIYGTWHCELGTIKPVASGTDGIIVAEYMPGTILGKDSVYFSLHMLEPEWAANIDVTSETESLAFPLSLRSPVSEGVFPLGREIKLYATMMDDHGNCGTTMPVEWAGEKTDSDDKLTIRPRQGFTDPRGYTTATVSSATAGTFKINLRSHDSGKGAVFGPITFGDTPLAPPA